MLKYHKEIGFYPCHVAEVKAILKAFEYKRLTFSRHGLQELMNEVEAVNIGKFLKDYTFTFENVFEIAISQGILEKIGFRISFNEFDLICILSRDKSIITIWTNKKEDQHFTLNIKNYQQLIGGLKL